MTVLVAFAMLALGLASVGLYGVLSYAVSQRRRELGVRAALGAARRDLVALVVRDGLTVTAVGLALGLAGAAALTRLMQGMLFGVTPLDAVSFLAAPAVLTIVAIAACLLPAARAARIDPAQALRSSDARRRACEKSPAASAFRRIAPIRLKPDPTYAIVFTGSEASSLHEPHGWHQPHNLFSDGNFLR